MRGVVFKKMTWGAVEFLERCDLSSGVCEGISLAGRLFIADCVALYAQFYKYYKFKVVGDDTSISVLNTNLWGSLFEDYAENNDLFAANKYLDIKVINCPPRA